MNFSTWNIDLSYSWQFVQGSFLTFLYRNQLFNSNNQSQEDFSQSLSSLFNQPMQNTFSLRVQYFIDYNGLKGIFKRKQKVPNNVQAKNIDNRGEFNPQSGFGFGFP